MKSAIVPAQITTVEDKVTGNLSFSQLLLLIAPIFLGSALFAILPPAMEVVTYKVVAFAILCSVFGLLAVRIRGRILLMWLITISRYNLRPRYYIFDKNDPHLRETQFHSSDANEPTSPKSIAPEPLKPAAVFTVQDALLLEQLVTNPQAGLHFSANKRGGLDVRVTEVK